jgi:hypothetical protein
MDWFERLTGFVERDYAATRSLLHVIDGRLESKVNRRSYSTGRLETPTLNELRVRAGAVSTVSKGRVKVTCNVYLTRVGGGAFGNDDDWIDRVMRRALTIVRDIALEVRLVSYGDTPEEFLRLQHEYDEHQRVSAAPREVNRGG